ncbi:MAG: cysteine desulfurase family protein [Lachnospiraceae bacterium]
MIYLDYASNTPTDEDVLQTFVEVNQRMFGNPNSLHQAGREAQETIEEALQSIAADLHCNKSELIITSGASESNNTAIKGYARVQRHTGRHILSTCLEHSSVSASLTALQTQGYEIELLDLTPEGRVDLNSLKELIRKDTILLAITAVDSELGVVQPLAEIQEVLREYPDCILHVDATQAIGKIPFCLNGLQSVSFSPHKFYGINGVGILYKREDMVVEPLIHGGSSTTVYRSGTPMTALTASAAAAVHKAVLTLPETTAAVERIRNRIGEFLESQPGVYCNNTDYSIPHILNISVPGYKALRLQELLDAQGICVSTKSACAVPNTPSRAVFAVTKDKKRAVSSIRISISHLTTSAEADTFCQAFARCLEELKT